MDIMLTCSAVEGWFDPRSDQTKDSPLSTQLSGV
jgi:hypothetical protein